MWFALPKFSIEDNTAVLLTLLELVSREEVSQTGVDFAQGYL